jgi:hypothetical protein
MTGFNKIFFILILLFSFSGIDMLAQVASPVSVTGHIMAEVISVFSASETSQMNFGRFSPGPEGGLIVLTPEGTISVLGSVFSGTGMHNAASFNITGDNNATFSISIPMAPVILAHTSSARTMLVTDWVSQPSSGINAGMLRNGTQVAYVGATLNVGTLNDNPVGIYTGTYAITFDFN